jgi:hypothetical protein
LGESFTWSVSNTLCTREPGETTEMAGSLWFRWVAPRNGLVRLSYDPTNTPYDQRGAVFKGPDLGHLQVIQSPAVFGLSVFPVEVGTEYLIAVAGGAEIPSFIPATFHLNFLNAPPNDAFLARTRINSRSESLVADAGLATTEPSDPTILGLDPNLGTVWWEWTAPAPGLLSIIAYGGRLALCHLESNGALAVLKVVDSTQAKILSPLVKNFSSWGPEMCR